MMEFMVPGKLFIAGEYAVTHPGVPGMVFAVDRFMQVTIAPADDYRVTSDLLGEVTLEAPTAWPTKRANTPWQLVSAAFDVTYAYMQTKAQPMPGFHLTLTSHMTEAGKKIGLGSSGATVVGVIKAVASFWQLSLTPLEIYRLAVLAMLHTPKFNHGSFGDIAAASFGGLLLYAKPTTQGFINQTDLNELLTMPWPNLLIEPLKWPATWSIQIGWTQAPADTQSQLMKQPTAALMQAFDADNTMIVSHLVHAIKTQDFTNFAKAVLADHLLISDYLRQTNRPYLTPVLQQLIADANALNLPAKVSGAGNGDNGLAFSDGLAMIAELHQQWQSHAIMPLPLNIYYY